MAFLDNLSLLPASLGQLNGWAWKHWKAHPLPYLCLGWEDWQLGLEQVRLPGTSLCTALLYVASRVWWPQGSQLKCGF